jgi:hypothetical protein
MLTCMVSVVRGLHQPMRSAPVPMLDFRNCGRRLVLPASQGLDLGAAVIKALTCDLSSFWKQEWVPTMGTAMVYTEPELPNEIQAGRFKHVRTWHHVQVVSSCFLCRDAPARS